MEFRVLGEHEKGAGYPEIIYKYRNWDVPLHRSILVHNELYFASPGQFNDPFDCRITNDFSLLDSPEKKKAYVNKIAIETFEQWKDNNQAEQIIKNFDKRLQNIEQVQQEYETLIFSEQDKHYGVLCFSAIWSDILMWSHYANCHSGITVGFYEHKIRNIAKTQGQGGMVIYDSKFPRIDPLNDKGIKEMFLSTHYKSKQWQYECEYRVSKLFYPNLPTHTERTIKVLDDFFAEVILGLNISPVNEREVISLCKSKKIPVYKAKKVANQFRLTCQPL